jgi:hypothetical protein
MLPIIISTIVLCALGLVCAYVGTRLVRAMRDQFDELMPQRMVDYSGFIDGPVAED